MYRRVLVCAVVLAATSAHADPMPAALRAHAVRRTTAIDIDGHLDEPAWQTATRQRGFSQRFPIDGGKAAFDTSFAVLYDDEAIYVGVWCADPEPQKIRQLLTRRDVDVPADYVVLGIDSYHDRRTGYAFQLNAAGVQRDSIIFDDNNQDDTWDAVWTGNSAITPSGWTAEYRIPLSQLRYDSGDTNVWGLQLVRFIGRTQEQDAWSPWPRSAPGVVSRFGTLDGVDHLAPSRRLELLPYVTGGIERQPIEAGDPLNRQYAPRGDLGLDLKYGLGPAFTLSATINPDFGQVEADPSQITLGPFELYYPEKRPFFLEGTDLFRLPIGQNDQSNEGAFYSRRIGNAPDIGALDYEYIDAPKSTVIYGAAKLTGKTRSGWSVGLLDAVTGPAQAPLIDDGGHELIAPVEALTNYAVARVKHDWRDGATQLGGSFTAVDRQLDNPELAATLHDQAYTAGLQLTHRWDHDEWQLQLHGLESYVHGSESAIAFTQEDSNHYFQRPDATDASFDPTRTSLTGSQMTWKIARDGDVPHWRFGNYGELRTPGLEINDLGFQAGGDRVVQSTFLQYREDKPHDQVLNWGLYSEVYTFNTFEGRLTDLGADGNGNIMLDNYWNFGFGFNLDGARWDITQMRGGDALHIDPNYNFGVGFATDTRKWIWFSMNGGANLVPQTGAIAGNINANATIQAAPNIDLSIGPSWQENDNPMQYVNQAVGTDQETHYVFAAIKQTTVSMTTRVDWTFSPHLSLQAYAQPFIATGRYSAYKDVDNPEAVHFSDRFSSISGNQYAEDDTYVYIHRNGVSYTIDRPDFDLRQLHSTIVLRWEYRPGSSVFAIWSHGQTNSLIDGRFDLGRDLPGLAHDPSDDVVMVKVNYWFGL